VRELVSLCEAQEERKYTYDLFAESFLNEESVDLDSVRDLTSSERVKVCYVLTKNCGKTVCVKTRSGQLKMKKEKGGKKETKKKEEGKGLLGLADAP
jgi:hypothetical protein